MKIINLIKLYLIDLPVVFIVSIWTAFCTLLEHIINEYRIK
jgi:hypothetical protein